MKSYFQLPDRRSDGVLGSSKENQRGCSEGGGGGENGLGSRQRSPLGGGEAQNATKKFAAAGLRR